eukprot:COSAG04_NODE_184_length_21108_cov_56.740492_12_plen_220_part_00
MPGCHAVVTASDSGRAHGAALRGAGSAAAVACRFTAASTGRGIGGSVDSLQALLPPGDAAGRAESTVRARHIELGESRYLSATDSAAAAAAAGRPLSSAEALGSRTDGSRHAAAVDAAVSLAPASSTAHCATGARPSVDAKSAAQPGAPLSAARRSTTTDGMMPGATIESAAAPAHVVSAGGRSGAKTEVQRHRERQQRELERRREIARSVSTAPQSQR